MPVHGVFIVESRRVSKVTIVANQVHICSMYCATKGLSMNEKVLDVSDISRTASCKATGISFLLSAFLNAPPRLVMTYGLRRIYFRGNNSTI